MQSRNFLIFPIFLALLSGCAGPSISPEQRAALEQPARALEAQGDWRAAALTWQQTSQTVKGDLASELKLNAADALLKAGDGLGAAQIARELPQSLAPALSTRRALVLADAALLTGDPTDALRRVGPELTTSDPRMLARARRIRADALEMTGEPMEAARERSLRDSLLGQTQARYRNRQRIWELLAQVPTDQLEVATAEPVSPFRGWLELAVLARRNALDVDQLDTAIGEWTIRYPGHPAGEEIVPEVIELARAESGPPTRVALLLPQTGPFASAAAAIREGFMAAWFADAPNEYRPEIMLLDTHAQDAAFAYTSAISDGAQFVVGPLAKESVRAVIDDTSLGVTTLVLNYPRPAPPASDPGANAEQGSSAETATADQPTQQAPALNAAPSTTTTEPGADSSTRERDLRRVFYFVLSPEDEARRAAEYAYERGARQAAVLSVAGAWGERVGDAFAQRWEALGGVLVMTTRFEEEAQGLSTAVKQLLNIDRSKARAKQLRSVLVRNMKHEPQPRTDIDVIFMAAFPQSARQIRPLLLFHRAARVPLIATSHVYSGIVDPQTDLDLNDVIFAEMPWVVTPAAHSLPEQAQRLWPDSRGPSGRLYAFGADAYTLIGKLRELRVTGNGSYPGLTGMLSLDAQQHLRRDMQWSQFVDGVAKPIDTDARESNWPTAQR